MTNRTKNGAFRRGIAASGVGALLLVTVSPAMTPAAAAAEPMSVTAESAQPSTSETGVPSRPMFVMSHKRVHGLFLTWSAPVYDYGSEVIGYVVIVDGVGTVTTDADARALTIPGLAEDTAYRVSIQAVNAAGTGAAVTMTARTAGVPGQPWMLSAKKGRGMVELGWSSPAMHGDLPVTGYVVEVDGRTLETDELSLLVEGLADGTTYEFGIRAVNDVGTGPAASISATTLPAEEQFAPHAPQALFAKPGAQSLELRWSAPSSGLDTPPVTGYEVEVDGRTFSASDRRLTVTGLEAGTSYTVSVRAINSVGRGNAETVTAYTGNAPSVPRDLIAIPGAGSVDLYWASPADSGRLPNTYRVEIDGRVVTGSPNYDALPAGAAEAGGYHRVHLDGLAEGRTYEARVTLSTAGGSSPTVSRTVSPLVSPTTVRDLATTVTTGSITARWNAPATWGTSDPGSYVVMVSDGQGDVVRSAQTTDTTATLTGLAPETAYTVTVRAIGDAGLHTDSEVSAVTAHSRPDRPTADAWMDQRALLVAWQPGSAGSTPITGYRVTAGGRTCTTGPDARSCRITGLADDTTYQVAVVALSDAGPSPALVTTGRTTQAGATVARSNGVIVAVRVADLAYPSASGCYAVPITVRMQGASDAWWVESTLTRTGSKSPNASATVSSRAAGTIRTTAHLCPKSDPAGRYLARTVVTVQTASGTEELIVPVSIDVSGPSAKVKARAVSRGSELHVDVNPDKGKGSWTIQVQRKQASGSWKRVKAYSTKGNAETRTINLPKGRYRVIVSPKYGYTGATSAEVSLTR